MENCMEKLDEKRNPYITFNEPIVSYVKDEETGLWGIGHFAFVMYDQELDPFYVKVFGSDEIEIDTAVPYSKNKYSHITFTAYILEVLQVISFNLELSEIKDHKPEIQEWIESKNFFKRYSDYLEIETTWEELREVYNHEPF